MILFPELGRMTGGVIVVDGSGARDIRRAQRLRSTFNVDGDRTLRFGYN